MHYWVRKEGLELLANMFKIREVEYYGLVPIDTFLKQAKCVYEVEINVGDPIARIAVAGDRKEIVHYAR